MSVKKPNVAGQFYPAKPAALRKMVADFISTGQQAPYSKRIPAIIAPHAGYAYSGAVAGTAYRSVQHHPIQSVIVIAPSHFTEFEGISIWGRGALETPLGEVQVNADLATQFISEKDHFCQVLSAFEKEHSLEVQLPFIQCLFPAAAIVPVIMGEVTFSQLEMFAVLLHKIVTHRSDILVVVSSDMSHYYDANTANRIDHKTLNVLLAMDPSVYWKACKSGHLQMCGYAGVTAMLLWAQLAHFQKLTLLQHTHSGKTTGDDSKVVGYAALALEGNMHA